MIFVRVTGLKHEEIMFSSKETTRNKDWVSLRFITVQSDLQTLANDTIGFFAALTTAVMLSVCAVNLPAGSCAADQSVTGGEVCAMPWLRSDGCAHA